MRFSIIISIAILFVVSIFGFASSNSLEQTLALSDDEQIGRVLGATESDLDWQETINDPVKETRKEEKIIPIKNPEAVTLDLDAASALAVDIDSGQNLLEKDSGKMRSIASLTKLFAALVIIDKDIDWDEEYRLVSADIRDGGLSHVYAGESLKRSDYFRLALVASDNTSIIALVHSLGMSEEAFVRTMNIKAGELGLTNTVFVDAVGLSDGNISTAKDVAVFVKLALSNEMISDSVMTKSFILKVNNKERTVYSTDQLLNYYPRRGIALEGGKTGFTNSAGYCFAGVFSQAGENRVVTVILGGATPNSRFDLTKQLVDWVYGNYKWKKN